jgi:phage host-nuclease inhibitor protein Gam
MIEEIRELFQNFIAPQLESIKGDIRALDTKIDSFRNELLAEIHRVEKVQAAEFNRLEQVLSTDLVRLEQKVDTNLVRLEEKMDTKLGAMNEKLELQRRELLAELKAALR